MEVSGQLVTPQNTACHPQGCGKRMPPSPQNRRHDTAPNTAPQKNAGDNLAAFKARRRDVTRREDDFQQKCLRAGHSPSMARIDDGNACAVIIRAQKPARQHHHDQQSAASDHPEIGILRDFVVSLGRQMHDPAEQHRNQRAEDAQCPPPAPGSAGSSGAPPALQSWWPQCPWPTPPPGQSAPRVRRARWRNSTSLPR